MRSLAATAADVEVLPPDGGSFVVKDSTGAQVQFEVNSSGEIIIAPLPAMSDGTAICRDQDNGKLTKCPPGLSGFVLKSGSQLVGFYLGSHESSHEVMSAQGYRAQISSDGLHAGPPYSFASLFLDPACAGEQVYPPSYGTRHVVEFNGLLQMIGTEVLTDDIYTDFGDGSGCQNFGVMRFVLLKPNDPSITGFPNGIGIPSDPYPDPILVEPRS